MAWAIQTQGQRPCFHRKASRKNLLRRSMSRLRLQVVHFYLRAQRGPAGDARLRAVSRGNDWYLARPRIYRQLGDALFEATKERLVESRRSTADHDYLRIEQVDHVAEPYREHVSAFHQHFAGEGISGGVGFSHDFAGDSIQFSPREFEHRRFSTARNLLSGVPRNSTPGSKHFYTPRLAAAADRAAIIDADVPTFTRRPGAAVVNLAVHDNPRTDAGPNRGVENIVISARSAPAGFRQRSGVSVIVNFYGYGISLLESVGERKIAPAGQVGRIDDYAGCRIQGAGGAYPDAFDPCAVTQQLRDGRQNRA